MTLTVELLDELESFDPKYQQNYKTLDDACRAAGDYVYSLWQDYLQTADGKARQAITESTRDYLAENEARKAQLDREISMSNRGKSGGAA